MVTRLRSLGASRVSGHTWLEQHIVREIHEVGGELAERLLRAGWFLLIGHDDFLSVAQRGQAWGGTGRCTDVVSGHLSLSR